MRNLMAGALALALLGCGGGGGGSGGGSSPAPAPTLTFSPQATYDQVENVQAVTTLSASGSAGSTAVFSVSGGVDQGRFEVVGGVLQFREPPNFELPLDDGRDNVYQIEVTASASGLDRKAAMTITVLNDDEGVLVRRVATGLGDVIGMMRTPHAGGNYAVATRDGTIYRLDSGFTVVNSHSLLPYYSRSFELQSIATGFWRKEHKDASAADFWAAVAYDNGDGTKDLSIEFVELNSAWPNSRNVRWAPVTLLSSTTTNATASLRSAITAEDLTNFLYVAISDGGVPGDADDASDAKGSIYRIAHVCVYCSASVPTSKFVSVHQAKGLRDPVLTGGFEADSGGVVGLFDRGAGPYDELMVHADGHADYGWPRFVGFNETNDAGATNAADALEPGVVLDRGTGPYEVSDIGAGVMYDVDPDIGVLSLASTTVFSDSTGRIMTVASSQVRNMPGDADFSFVEDRTQDFVPDAGTIDRPIAMLQTDEEAVLILDEDGELYLVTQRD